MKQELKRECFKDKYDFICCDCGYKQWARPSMSMTALGRNSGCGGCLGCKKFLHLQIEGGLDGEKMISMLWDDFLKKEGIKSSFNITCANGGENEN